MRGASRRAWRLGIGPRRQGSVHRGLRVTLELLFKLLAIFATAGVGWVAARAGWIGASEPATLPGQGAAAGASGLAQANRVLSDAAYNIFVPALLFRTMARMDFAAMPWTTLVAYFAPVLAYLGVFYAWQQQKAARLQSPSQLQPPPAGGQITTAGGERIRGGPAAAAATLGVAATYGNSVQLGIPMAAALFGEAGLGLHLALVSLHGLVVLTLLTVLAEVAIARSGAGQSLLGTVKTAVRSAVFHPVMLPILLGLAWNLTGLGLHPVVDALLLSLTAAVVPLCLFLIGTNLAQYGLRGRVRGALGLSVLKLLVLPAVVLLGAHFVFGVSGLSLSVLVMMAAAPVGSNALIFALRYRTHEAEATAAIVLSTVAFVFTSSLWVAVLALLGW